MSSFSSMRLQEPQPFLPRRARWTCRRKSAPPDLLHPSQGRRKQQPIDTRSFCSAFLHAPAIGLRRGKRSPALEPTEAHTTTLKPHRRLRTHANSARTTSDTSASESIGPSPRAALSSLRPAGPLPPYRSPFTLQSAVSKSALPGSLPAPLVFRRDNCNFCLCQPSNPQPPRRSTRTLLW